MTLGITTALPGIVETNFVGHDIIIMEQPTSRTQYVYNTLQLLYGDKMVIVNGESRASERRISDDQITKDESPIHVCELPSRHLGLIDFFLFLNRN